MADDPTPPTPPADAPPTKTWEEVLSGLDDSAKAAYEQHTGGLKSALDKERAAAKEHADRLKALETEKQQADEKRLAEQGEYKTLAEKRAEELAAAMELAKAKQAEAEKALAERDAHANVLSEHVKKQIDSLGLPKPVVQLLEGKTPLERLEWLNANAKDLKGAGGLLPPSPPGDRNGKVDTEKALKLSPRTF
jgi:HD superfamily phosphohydrolase